MKKIVLVLALFFLSFTFTGCTGNEVEFIEYDFTSDYIRVTDEENVFKKVDYTNLLKLINESSDAKVVYFGGKWCPYCQGIIGYVNDVAKEQNIDTIYNFDFRIDANDSSSDIRKCLTEETKKQYADLIYQLDYVNPNGTVVTTQNQDSTISDDDKKVILSENGSAIPRMTVPTIVVIKNGKIVSFLSDCYKDNGETDENNIPQGEVINGQKIYSPNETNAANYRQALIELFSKLN